MAASKQTDTIVVFPSSLGWIAMIGSGRLLKRLSFGHASEEAAMDALEPGLIENAVPGTWNGRLVRRLQAYAAGEPDDFRDVEIDPGPQTVFQRRVTRYCRRIPYGATLTYGGLATRAGYPGAARAVGRCMAANRIPLVVPCHRVVASDGRLGGYSAVGHLTTKRRLLDLEAGVR